MSEPKRKPKAGAPRTEVFAMRLDPKLKYLAELAARKQRRSIANYIEAAIEAALRGTLIDERATKSVWDEAEELWDITDAARLVKLARLHPDLLSYSEQAIVKAIREVGFVDFSHPKRTQSFAFRDAEGNFLLQNIEACWDEVVRFAEGQIDKEALWAAMRENIKEPVSDRRNLDPLQILKRHHG